MARSKRPARLMKWRDDWYLFWTDHGADGAQRRTKCTSLGATTRAERLELVKEYRQRELHDAGESGRRGGRLAYDTPLVDALTEFLVSTDERVEARATNPRARSGLSASTGKYHHLVIEHFQSWLKSNRKGSVTTGGLDRAVLQRYLGAVASEPIGNGDGTTYRKAVSVNFYARILRTALRWVDGQRPPRFPDFQTLLPAFKMLREEDAPPAAFAPEEMQTFVARALERDDPDRQIVVERQKGGKVERFEQTVVGVSATPASRLFLLLALLGCRLGEALALRWTHCDLERGRITITAEKTGRTRIVPLIGAPEGSIAPRFLDLLRIWRAQSGQRFFVLPHGDLDIPVFPKRAWTVAAKGSQLPNLTPQRLRQNFASYAASLGVPAAVAALWQGHQATVAERWYRAQVLDRMPGHSFEEAMGLLPVIERQIEAAVESGEPRALRVAP